MMMIDFMIGFDTDNFARDSKNRDVTTTDRCLRINAGYTARCNSIGSCVYFIR